MKTGVQAFDHILKQAEDIKLILDVNTFNKKGNRRPFRAVEDNCRKAMLRAYVDCHNAILADKQLLDAVAFHYADNSENARLIEIGRAVEELLPDLDIEQLLKTYRKEF